MDGLEAGYYNSDTRKVVRTGDWIKDNNDTEYWDLVATIALKVEEGAEYWVSHVLSLFNQTEGIHTLQWMTGCELDDDGTKRGYSQFGYDGEDFLSLDVNTYTWTPANIVAVLIKHQLDQTDAAASEKTFLEMECIKWLQTYVDYGKETLNSRVPPEVSLFQKDSSSPVVCHATGFFPKPVSITWQKNGEDLDEDVDLGKTLPNLDDTFQKRSILTVSPEELDKHTYTCVIQHVSLEKEMVLQVKSRGSVGVLIGSIIGAAVLVILVGVGVYVWVKRRNNPGLHALQCMTGCELDDDGTKRVYGQCGYDGEDFLGLDVKTYTVTAANAVAVIVKHQLEQADAAEYMKIFLDIIFIDWLKKYMDYGKETLNRKVRPEVSLFQKNSSSPVVCHATGFFPKAVSITWQKNGEDLDEDVELRETLPNLDETFQRRSILTVSPEDLKENDYTCVIQHISLKKAMVLHVNESPGEISVGVLIGIIIGAAVLVILVGVGVYVWVKRRNNPGTHSLDFYLTGVKPRISIPELTVTAYVDGLEGGYYNSDIRKVVRTGDWIKDNNDTEHWDFVAQIAQNVEESVEYWVSHIMSLFNQTEGIHTLQWMTGCELDDDGTKRGYSQIGYDGEDFLSLDVNTYTWTPANDVAVIINQELDQTKTVASEKYFLETECIEWLQRYVDYGKETLNRTVPPEVSLFQKNSSVVCHATGFFPRPVMISWQKNGEDVDEDVDLGKTLPNLDDTFQKRSILTVSPEELDKHNYTCIIQHSGLEKEMVLQVNESRVAELQRLMLKETDEDQNYEPYLPPAVQKQSGTTLLFSTAALLSLRVRGGRQCDVFIFVSTGIHTFQCMTGCKLDEDGSIGGYLQCGYDGEDFLSLDMKTLVWTAANFVAVIMKQQLEQSDTAEAHKIFLETACIEWLQKYVDYGRETLNRTVPPEVSLFQKDSSSPVVCHATGFFPKALSITWQKNGEDLDEDVELRETLPNLDDTFQRRSILTVSPEDLKENDYTCVIQHISLEKEMVLQVNKPTGKSSVGVLIGIIIGAAVLVILVGVGVYVWVKRRNNP
ncbi:hypothetical protein NFI96_016675, partial [Prochilodus magdalenae]